MARDKQNLRLAFVHLVRRVVIWLHHLVEYVQQHQTTSNELLASISHLSNLKLLFALRCAQYKVPAITTASSSPNMHCVFSSRYFPLYTHIFATSSPREKQQQYHFRSVYRSHWNSSLCSMLHLADDFNKTEYNKWYFIESISFAYHALQWTLNIPFFSTLYDDDDVPLTLSLCI